MFLRRGVLLVVLVASVTLVASCRGDDDGGASPTSATSSATTSTSAPAPGTVTTARPVVTGDAPCGYPGRAPRRYDSIVVFSFENRTWSAVGDRFAHLPYLHALASACTSFLRWTETDPQQNSLTQYVGQVTGARQPGVENDCSPSASCSTTADNLFRQARAAGLTAINYVEGAAGPCSAEGNAAKHVPPLYLWGADDRAHCRDQVRPYREFRPDALPDFAFVTPTLCHDGHDCGNGDVDRWARENVTPVIESDAYRAGKVAVFIWYDEDTPVPNLWVMPTARAGAVDLEGAGYAGTLAAWESMLGLPCLANACGAPDMRAAANG